MAKKIIISGGGTGGHIFPAVSIANALKAIDSSIEILFVGALGRMEMEKVPAAGYKIIGLPIAGFQRRLTFENITFFFKLAKSLLKARKIIKDFKPDAVVGVGGYASGPVLRMAARKKIPIFIQEQNSYAGVTNRLLAKKAKQIFVAYHGMEKYFPKEKIILTGNPVRQDLESINDKRSEAIAFFKLDENKPIVLSIGGSLGARTINQSIAAHIKAIEKEGIQIVWQCGKYYHNDAKEILQKQANPSSIHLYDFIGRMDLAYAAADIIISRAGAGSISELCLVGKPVILVPSPNVAEDHQTQNALALVKNNAAIMVRDIEANEILMAKAIDTLKNTQLKKELAENISKMALRNAAHNIASEILKQTGRD